jgi:hypothetical protein
MSRLTGGDLTANVAVGGIHPKPLKAVATNRERLHGNLVDNSQVGAPAPEPVNIFLPDDTNLVDFVATVRAYMAAHA